MVKNAWQLIITVHLDDRSHDDIQGKKKKKKKERNFSTNLPLKPALYIQREREKQDAFRIILILMYDLRYNTQI